MAIVFNVDIVAGLKWLIYSYFYYLQEVRKKIHCFVNNSVTTTCISFEVSHALKTDRHDITEFNWKWH